MILCCEICPHIICTLKLNHDKRHGSLIPSLSLHFITFFSQYIFLGYVIKGNVAWAHLCAKEKLKSDAKRISGLPIFITDDSPVTDSIRLTQRINSEMQTLKIRPTSWSIPLLLCALIAWLYELFIDFINYFTKYQVEYCPHGILAYLASFVLLDRLRASIALEYEPIYTPSESFKRSGTWYDTWYLNYKETIKQKNKKT